MTPDFSLTVPNTGPIVPVMGTKAASKARGEGQGLSIADALFPKVRQRVLGILFLDAGRSFYAKELIRLAESGTGAVQRELARLEASGLVVVTQVGNQKHYQANAASPVFEELQGLLLKTAGLADVVRSSLSQLAPRIRGAFIFGSIAKGESTAGSDVDLLVISDDLTHGEVYSALADAERRLGRRINPSVYTRSVLVQRQRQDNAFVTRILSQPKIWLVGGDDVLRS